MAEKSSWNLATVPGQSPKRPPNSPQQSADSAQLLSGSQQTSVNEQ